MKRNRGFSLIEILVVCAFIGIIVTYVDELSRSRSVTASKECLNGVLHKNGAPVVKDGVAVRC